MCCSQLCTYGGLTQCSHSFRSELSPTICNSPWPCYPFISHISRLWFYPLLCRSIVCQYEQSFTLFCPSNCSPSVCHDHAWPLPRPSQYSNPSPATPKLIAVPQLNSGHYVSLRPRTSHIVFQPQAWSKPGISDLSPSLDETPNLVWPLLDSQLYYSSILDAMLISDPGLPCTFFLARSPV